MATSRISRRSSTAASSRSATPIPNWPSATCCSACATSSAKPCRCASRCSISSPNITREISARGEFNFLLSNGNCLYAHCATKLAYIVRQAPFAVAHLKDQDVSVDFSAVTNPDDRVAVIATLPLTDNEAWTTMEPGTLMVFHEGMPAAEARTA
jgi:predicted glutamine amidotransferase